MAEQPDGQAGAPPGPDAASGTGQPAGAAAATGVEPGGTAAAAADQVPVVRVDRAGEGDPSAPLSPVADELAEAMTPPPTADDYDTARVKLSAEDAEFEIAPAMETARGWALDMGLSTGEFSSVVSTYNTLMADPTRHDPAAIEKRQMACAKTLKALWGADSATNLRLVWQEINRLGDEFKFFLEETRLGDDPQFTHMILTAVKEREARARRHVARAERNGPPAGMTADQAKAEIDKITAAAGADPLHPYTNRRHPEHAATAKQMDRLYKAAYPGGAPPIY